MPYTAQKPPLPETTDQLRARVPGWGADLDPADRPNVPREVRQEPGATGAHWDLPEQQEEKVPRERSIEHARLTPVFGSTLPPRGVSGLLRRRAFAYSEARAAHWLILLAADRVDVVESDLRDLLRGRPGNPVATGLRSEVTHHGLASRSGPRTDRAHLWMDPFVTAGPLVLAAAGAAVLGRRLLRRG